MSYNTSNLRRPATSIQSLVIDSRGNKWMGTLGGGLVKFDGTSWTRYSIADSTLPNDYVYSVAADRILVAPLANVSTPIADLSLK